jgi:antitoxin PrlF
MITLTVTAKGQVTLRKEILEHLGVKPGSKIIIDLLDGGFIKAGPEGKKDISRLFGSLKPKSGKKLTIAQMNKVISDAWAGKR